MPSEGSTSARTASAITVPPAPDSVGLVRRALRATLDRAGVAEDTVDTAILLTSELVTNAVLHARTDVQVTVVVDSVDSVDSADSVESADGADRVPRARSDVRVEVHDESGALPATRSHALDSMTGRGLQIVGQLADDYGVEVTEVTATDDTEAAAADHPSGGGKTVWFRLVDGRSPVHQPTPEAFPDLVQTAGPTITVEWRGLPLLLFDVVLEHNEALMREFALERLGDLDPSDDFTPPPVAAAAAARARLGQAVAESRRQFRTSGHVDVALRLEASDVDALAGLLPLLAEAEELSAAGRILTRPALPELRELREWCITEIVRQAAGAAPRPWRTPLVEDRVPVRLSADLRAAAEDVRSSPEALVLADPEVIVAVAPEAARLLGWDGEDLVGRRITVVVPPDLRDIHLAGITRHLMTGRTTMLGVEVPIDAWHRKGYRLPVRLLLDRWPGVRSLFVARFTAADQLS